MSLDSWEQFGSALRSASGEHAMDRYIGELKRNPELWRALDQSQIILPECDNTGNITEKDLFVQYLIVDGGHLLLCLQCQPDRESILQQVLTGEITSSACEEIRRSYCNHATAVEALEPAKLFEIESNIIYHDTKDVQVISKKPYKCCVYLRGQYGLLTFPPRAKKHNL